MTYFYQHGTLFIECKTLPTVPPPYDKYLYFCSITDEEVDIESEFNSHISHNVAVQTEETCK